jgi:predicted RNase H-like nuclease (RuvC/YqgF family)
MCYKCAASRANDKYLALLAPKEDNSKKSPYVLDTSADVCVMCHTKIEGALYWIENKKGWAHFDCNESYRNKKNMSNKQSTESPDERLNRLRDTCDKYSNDIATLESEIDDMQYRISEIESKPNNADLSDEWFRINFELEAKQRELDTMSVRLERLNKYLTNLTF